MELADINGTVVDGVTTFWIDAPSPFTAVLLFRVGAWDERPTCRGITHLVEHLAMFEQRTVDHPHNAFVAGDHTAFFASGTPEEVMRYLRGIVSSLRSLPTDRIGVEAGVLRAEEARRPRSTSEYILGRIFGLLGPGIGDLAERGLDWLDPETTQAWANRYFTATNAVLTLTGKPPAGLTLPLPAGEPSRFRLIDGDVDLDPEAGPYSAGTQQAGVAFGALTPRSVEAVTGLQIATRRLTDRLRHEEGLAYGIPSSYTPLDASTAYAFLGGDTQPDRALPLANLFIDTIREFAEHGPSDDELTWAHNLPSVVDPNDPVAASKAELHRRAVVHLLGHTYQSLDEIAEERSRMTTEGIGAAFRHIFHHGLIVGPPDLELPSVDPPTDPVDGRRFRRSGNDSEVTRLVVGQDGISAFGSKHWVTLRWDRILLADPHPDGSWNLTARDGSWIKIGSKSWRRGKVINQLIGDLVPKDSLLPVPTNLPDA